MCKERPITREERAERVRWANLVPADAPLDSRKHAGTIFLYEDALSRAEEANGKLVEALRECEEYFDQRADAEYFTDSPQPVPNPEMSMLNVVRDALALTEKEK